MFVFMLKIIFRFTVCNLLSNVDKEIEQINDDAVVVVKLWKVKF